jgi:hypothetical protein
MVTNGATRRNIELLTWIRAGSFVAVTAVTLATMPVLPILVTDAIAVGIGVLALLSPPAAVVAFVAVTAAGVATANITLGLFLMLVGISASPWLARGGATRFFLIVGPVLLTLGHAEWAPVAVAGFLLGSGEGAGTAVAACLLLEVVGFALGRPLLGAQASGGTASMMRVFSSGRPPSLSVETFVAQIRAFDGSALLVKMMLVRNGLLLIVQPLAWGAGAAVASVVGTRFKERDLRVVGAGAAAVAGTATVAAGVAAAAWLLHSPVSLMVVAITGAASLVLAAAWLLTWEGLFTSVPAPVLPADGRPLQATPTFTSPVDELLAQLAVAALRPGVVTVPTAVLVAEAFPTPAPGTPDPLASTATVLESYGARGTSGRGALVAAFDSATQALAAASEAQRAHVAAGHVHVGADVGIRIAVAVGATQLDVYRRPVGGPALAEACAVNTLTGPGQVLATAAAVTAAPGTPHSPLGQMTPATTGMPVDLVAVRWAETPVRVTPGPDAGAPTP